MSESSENPTAENLRDQPPQPAGIPLPPDADAVANPSTAAPAQNVPRFRSASGIYELSASGIYELGDTDDLSADHRDEITPQDILPPDAAAAPAHRGRFQIAWLSWIVAVIFVSLISIWATRAGLKVREDLWTHTRSIRYLSDIENAWYYGDDIMRRAEDKAALPAYSDAMAGRSSAFAHQPGMPNPNAIDSRRLTMREVLESVVAYYDYRIRSAPEGRYWMDYGPLRLTIMTLWVRHTQRVNPRMHDFPRNSDNDPRVDTNLGQPEDITRPLLQFNMICTAVAAVALFFLTWLWTVRGARSEPPEPLWPNSANTTAARFAQIFPPRLLAFMLATAGFWYALIALTGIPNRPAPIARLVEIQQTDRSIIVKALINPQDAVTMCHIDYGDSPLYGQQSAAMFAGNRIDDEPETMSIPAPPDGQTLHLRVTANSYNGFTHTPDFAVTTPLNQTLNPIGIEAGGMQWPDWTVWLRLGGLFVAMCYFARRLPMPHRGWACGLVAALLVWFDPSIMMNAIAWPQWDVWILPLFCLAALAASLDWWIAAGIFIGIGCLLKGQMLLGGPVLLFWPLFSGRFGAVIKLISGAALAVGAIVWPFIVPTSAANYWMVHVEIVASVMLLASLIRGDVFAAARHWTNFHSPRKPLTVPEKRRYWTAVIATLFALLFITGLWDGVPKPLPPLGESALIALAAIIVLGPFMLPRGALVMWMAAISAGAVWMAAWLFNGDFNWWLLSINYGSTKQDKIQMGAKFFSNLPGMMAVHYGWNLHDIVGTISLHLGHWQYTQDMELKFTMSLIYAICLILCGLAASLSARRGDPKFLIAIMLPWLIFPTIMCQMGERYLIWPAALSAAFITVSTGLTLIHILIAWLGAGMIAAQLLSRDSGRWPNLASLFEKMYPDAAWILLLLCAILLVQMFVPTRRRSAIDLA